MGEIAKDNVIDLRQSYVRIAKQTLIMVGRYRHAKQMKRPKKSMRKLHTYLERLIRDVERKASEMGEELLEAFLKAKRIYHQKTKIHTSFCPGMLPKWSASAKGNLTNLMNLGARFL